MNVTIKYIYNNINEYLSFLAKENLKVLKQYGKGIHSATVEILVYIEKGSITSKSMT